MLHWKGLSQVFDRHRVIANVFIPQKLARDGSRFGFLRMGSRADAERVIERLNGTCIYGSQIRVSFAMRRVRDSFWRRTPLRVQDDDISVGTSYIKTRRNGNKIFLCPTKDPCTNTENRRKS
ncbi:hypothetical protein GQ457_07G004770 [Hibiscus cannabinus]